MVFGPETLNIGYLDPLGNQVAYSVLWCALTEVQAGDVDWTSKMAKMMDPTLPIVSILRYWAITLGSFGGPGRLASAF